MIVPDNNDKPLILLVDDMPANLHVLVASLKRDYRIKTATSALAGLALAGREDRPQLILLDVMMPGMSGIEMLRQLRCQSETRDIPVIFVSADISEQSQLDGLALGADDYLTKPVVTSVLLARVRNILQRKRAETQLRLAAHVFQHSGEAIMVTDANNCILEVNPAFTRLTGYSPEDVRGRDPGLLSSGRATLEDYREMWSAILEKGFWQGEMWDRHKNGAVYPKLLSISVVRNAYGAIDFYIASFADISQQKATEERIRQVAHHDPLTGLPNRLHLQIALEQAIVAARRSGDEVALMFIDLDHFKHINDTLGHSIGDRLLMEVAQRLRQSVRESDLVARLGGDEFVVAMSGQGLVSCASHVAEKLLVEVARPYLLDGRTLHTSPSIGVSLYPHDGDGIETLMKNADTAMYHVKAQGRHGFQFFSEEMNRATADRLLLESSLHQALAQQQFILYYQPQINPLNGDILGVEALVRWQHPEHGLVTPDRFIPLAEESGIILPLGEWVLDAACRQLRCWRDAGQANLRMAVNLSVHQLRQPRLSERVAEILQHHGLGGADLELELTESAAMHDPEATILVLKSLRALGVALAIDDFGTGYSSLSYLKLLPIQSLKLDRAFVKDIETDPNDAAICSATIALAHALGLAVVAEGVETETQRSYLLQLGCDVMQGFLFSRPLPAEDLFLVAI